VSGEPRRNPGSGSLNAFGGPRRLIASLLVLALGGLVLWQAGIFGTDESNEGGFELQPALLIPGPEAGETGVGLRAGDLAPNFEFSAFDGRRLKLSDFRGRPVFLNFWATWCGPCRAELPAMATSLQNHEASGLAIVAMNNGEDFVPAERFLRDLEVQLTAFGYDPESSVARRYELIGMPTSYFIDADGVITRVVAGALNERQMESAVQEVIQGYTSAR
jgi:thiol-disulfide isomerase/thioredoxin